MAALAALATPADAREISSRNLGYAAMLGVAFGLGANVVALRFVPDVVARFTPLPWVAGAAALVLLGLEQGLRWGGALVVRSALASLGVPASFAFAVGVTLGTFIPAVFPWSAAGGVTPIPEMVQLAELIGERGVTFLMALSAGFLASGWRAFRSDADRQRALACATGALAIPLATFVQGRARIASIEAARAHAPVAHVALLQPATGALDRWDRSRAPDILAKLTAGTLRAEHAGAELTIWPEAAYPYPVAHATRRCPVGYSAILPVGVRGPVLTGLLMTGGHGDLPDGWDAHSAPGQGSSALVRRVAAGHRRHPVGPRHLLPGDRNGCGSGGGGPGDGKGEGVRPQLLRRHAPGGRTRGDERGTEPAGQRDQ